MCTCWVARLANSLLQLLGQSRCRHCQGPSEPGRLVAQALGCLFFITQGWRLEHLQQLCGAAQHSGCLLVLMFWISGSLSALQQALPHMFCCRDTFHVL
jgi:hypothetical protein